MVLLALSLTKADLVAAERTINLHGLFGAFIYGDLNSFRQLGLSLERLILPLPSSHPQPLYPFISELGPSLSLVVYNR